MTSSTPPPPRASISDVATAAGVSRAAVSKVIRNAYGVSPEMRDRVEAAIKELDYRPRVAARTMRGPSHTLGIEVPNLSSDFFAMVIAGAQRRLEGTPYQVVVAPGLGHRRSEEVLNSLIDRQVDGIIAIASTVPLANLERIGAQLPLVLLGRHDRSAIFDTVSGDDSRGAHLVMDHLFGLGHRRIAHVTITPPARRSPHAIRRSVYRRRMKDEGLEPTEFYLAGDPTSNAERLQRLLDAPDRPTAIFAAHDAVALFVLKATAELGLGYDDIAVVGYDDTAIAGHPLVGLTSVDQHGGEMGEHAVELLLSRLQNDRTAARPRRTEPVLRVRRSSGSPASLPSPGL